MQTTEQKPPLKRDVIPDGDPPKVPDEVKKALGSPFCVVLAPRFMTERTPGAGHPMAAVMQRAGVADVTKVNIAPMMMHSRFRKGDLVVVCVPCPDAPYSYKHAKLVGPVAIDDHWDPTIDGVGGCNTNTFFRALATAASPLYVSRREENGTFELRLA